MMILDGDFLTFAGEPVTGRMPARVVVQGSSPLSREQIGGVTLAYNNFCQALKVSLQQFTVDHRQLLDGTRIRMEHNAAQGDRIFVYPPDPSPLTRLVSLFFSVPANNGGLDNDAAPKFSKEWKFRGKTQPPNSLRPTRQLVELAGLSEHPGNLTWWSAGIKVNQRPLIVSWYGKATRYGRADYYGVGKHYASSAKQDFLYGPQDNAADARTNWQDAFKPAVWTNGIKHAVQKIVDDAPVPVRVMSAGLKRETEDGQDVLNLWVVSFDSNQLAVYKGKIDPYKTDAVTVTHQFDIDYRVDTTPYAFGDSSQRWWEVQLQPFYFNASCTKCASLVVTNGSSTTNANAAAAFSGMTLTSVAYLVCFAEVDLAAMTTSFAANHLTNTFSRVMNSQTDTSSGHTTSGTSNFTDTAIRQTYGAVDYVADVLTIVIVENTQVLVTDYSGSTTVPTFTITTFDTTISRARSASYRAFAYGAMSDLASSTFPLLSLDTLVGSGDALLTPTAGSGTYTWNATDPILLAAHVEGGDLRHGAVVISELLEIGDGEVSGTFDIFPDHETVTNSAYAADVHQRQKARRLSVWKDGSNIDTGTARKAYSATFETDGGARIPQGDNGLPMFEFAWAPPSGATFATEAGIDYLSNFGTDTGPGNEGGPDYAGGYPYVNTSAFAPDADTSQWCYSIGEYMHDSAPEPITFNPITAFVIAGTKDVADVTGFYSAPGNDNCVLASPIYLDNVPLQL